VYNKALTYRTESWYERQERVGYSETSSMLTNWKKEEELDFLNEVSCVPLQQGLRHLQTAFTNFFAGRAKYPNFKKKHNGGSAEFTKSAFRWKNGQVFLAKCNEPLPILREQTNSPRVHSVYDYSEINACWALVCIHISRRL
jgi:putative transposase